MQGLQKLTQLTYLDLHSNQIQYIQGLENLTQLTFLDLHLNQIHSIHGLENLIQLNNVDLSSNQLQSVQELENLTELIFLSLYLNQIQSVQGLKKLTKLEYLYLHSNQIQSAQEIHFPTTLASLYLNDNKIVFLNSLNHIKYLINLYLEYNLIEEIKSSQFIFLEWLKILNLKNNRIKMIGEQAFLSKEYVDLFNNVYITNISLNSFKRITFLRFSYKSLVQLKDYDHNYFDVDSLDLSRNKISTIFQYSIKGCFQYLTLKFNSIQIIEHKAFRYMPSLVEIDFSENLISHLDFHESFEFNQTNVKHLDFHSNEIIEIKAEFFTKFPFLKKLDLSFNKLQSMKKHFFTKYLNALEVLILNNNQILTIENNSQS